MMNTLDERNAIVGRMRTMAADLEKHFSEICFPGWQSDINDESPFVASACGAIEEGGKADAAAVAELIHFIADIIEKQKG